MEGREEARRLYDKRYFMDDIQNRIENQLDCPNVPPEIRSHHLRLGQLYHIVLHGSRGWFYYQTYEDTVTGCLSETPTRIFRSAYEIADEMTYVAVRSIASGDEKSYWHDVVGRTPTSVARYTLALTKTLYQYLSWVIGNPDGHIVVSDQPDQICYSCRGGLGIGKHCTKPIKPNKESSDRLVMENLGFLSRTRCSDIKFEVKDGIRQYLVPNTRLYDDKFFKSVTNL